MTTRAFILASINCFLVSLFCVYEFVLRVLPSSMTAKLSSALHTDATGIGVISGAFFIAYALMQVPVGLLFDKFSARVLLASSMAVCAIGTVFFALSQGLAPAVVGRLLTGAGAAFAVPGTFLLVSRWFPSEFFAFITGLVQCMCSLGAVIGQAPIAAMLHAYSWDKITIIIAIIGFAFSVLYFLVVRDAPKGHPVNSRKKRSISVLKCLKEVAKKPKNWLIAAYASFIWAPISILAALWGVPFLVAMYHFGSAEASTAIAWAWIGVAVGSPIIGWLTYKFDCTSLIMILAPILSFVVTSAMLIFPHIPLTVMDLLLFLFGFAAGTLPLSFKRIKQNNSKHTAGTAMGFNNMAVVLGGSIFQPLVGSILHAQWHGRMIDGSAFYSMHDYHVALLILPISALMCLALGIIINKNTNKGEA